MTQLAIHIDIRPAATVVRLEGWAGLTTQADLERAVTRLSAGNHQLLVLDLTQLLGLSSLAVGQLVQLHRAVTMRGGAIRVGGATEDARTVLVRCRMDMLIPLHSSVDEAIAMHA